MGRMTSLAFVSGYFSNSGQSTNDSHRAAGGHQLLGPFGIPAVAFALDSSQAASCSSQDANTFFQTVETLGGWGQLFISTLRRVSTSGTQSVTLSAYRKLRVCCSFSLLFLGLKSKSPPETLCNHRIGSQGETRY